MFFFFLYLLDRGKNTDHQEKWWLAEEDTLFLMTRSYFLRGLISSVRLSFTIFVLKMYYAMQISPDVPFAEVRGMIMCDLYHPVELICFMHYDYNQHILCCDPGLVFLANMRFCRIWGADSAQFIFDTINE